MGKIVAIVTTNKEKVAGGAPIFVADNREELEKLAFRLEKIMDCAVHDLLNGDLIVVEHE